jgi:hypothetical protein
VKRDKGDDFYISHYFIYTAIYGFLYTRDLGHSNVYIETYRESQQVTAKYRQCKITVRPSSRLGRPRRVEPEADLGVSAELGRIVAMYECAYPLYTRFRCTDYVCDGVSIFP